MQPTLYPSDRMASKPPQSLLFNHESLNASQYEAVSCLAGPVLVIAGAGSGKTRTLVYRLAHLVENGVPPERILLLTFTRKAAEEMLSRASSLLDDSCRHVMGGTFHGVANQLLRRYGSCLGYGANFTILDQGDAEGIINLIKSSLGLGKAGKRFPNKRTIISVLSKAVNRNVPLGELLDDQYQHLVDYLGDLQRIAEHYEKFKLEHGLMDYDDLLVNWKRLLEPEHGLKETIAGLFSHVMVDEYQDTNHVQAEIVRYMSHGHNNVMVVGDDSQSIYSFRGADFRNIMDFSAIFPGARIIRLEENYRSSQPILSMTNALIENASEKYTKTLFSRIEGGDKPTLHGARDEGAQARFVVDQIEKLRGAGEELREMAVLFRSGFHSYKLELELANRQIPFEKRGGLKLTESAHIKDVLVFLRVLVNPQDHLSWNRILLLLEKVGPKTVRTILDHIRATDDPLAALKNYPAAKSWRSGFLAMVEAMGAMQAPHLSPPEQFDLLMEYYRPIFERIYYDDYPRRGRDLDQLRTILSGYDNLQLFIDDTALDPPQANIEAAAEFGDSDDRLILSTIHSAKGLEWNTVFVIHLAEGVFPPPQAFLDEQREEERRLLYVASTRARRHLFLTYPREVMTVDRKFHRGSLSPFLAELSQGLFQTTGDEVRYGGSGFANRAYRPRSTSPLASPLVSPAAPSGDGIYAEGTAVRHNFFGEGVVRGQVGPRTVDVFFPRHGVKTLHLDYAKLEPVD